MKILAVDTSTSTACLGACDGPKNYEYNLQLGTRISALLVPAIKRMIQALGWGIEDIDCFAAGIGPGSFTGVRVGLATVKALSWSLNKPAAGIPSLDILARNAAPGHPFVIPVIDAKRGLVYCAVYKSSAGGEIKRATPYMLLRPEELNLKIRNVIPAKALAQSAILGDGLNVCAAQSLPALRNLMVLDKDHWRLEAGNLLELAKSAAGAEKFSAAMSLDPLYLYPKECQIRLPLSNKRKP